MVNKNVFGRRIEQLQQIVDDVLEDEENLADMTQRCKRLKTIESYALAVFEIRIFFPDEIARETAAEHDRVQLENFQVSWTRNNCQKSEIPLWDG